VALSAGSQVGPYEIIAPLGAGGMGEVYRARDTRLRREVALKVLPADVAGDAARQARFEQEAHAAAALNHPNILGIHDIGTDGGVFYMATELVNGETLAAVIERGPLPIRVLLDIAAQIADGMASAHAAGIVHRDLKPANVMIATDGRAKILDFGLAKQTTRPAVHGDETILVDQTEPGMIVGTVSYMSPEQARGKTADYRSDQFSFGLVLYEMTTGKRAFARDESVQTMAAIIAEEPPPIEVKLPAPLRWVIDRCLAKEAAGRYESSRDLARELRNIRDHLSEVSTEVSKPAAALPPAPGRRHRRWPIAAAFVLGAAVVFAVLLLRSGPAMPDQSAYRFTPFSFEPGGQGSAVWSPDGKAIAYAARQRAADPYQIYLRYLDSPTALQITHLPQSAFPIAWSPDNRRIVLLMRDKVPSLWSLAAVGGEPELMMTLPDRVQLGPGGSDVAITRDGKAVAVLQRSNAGLVVGISAPPGSPLVPYAPAPFTTKTIFNRPSIWFSPDGKQLLLNINAGRGGEESWLLPYPADGKTEPRRVIRDLVTFAGTPHASWMPDNRHVLMSLQTAPGSGMQLWLADTVTNERHALTSGTNGLFGASVAPDGQRLIAVEESGDFDVVSVDLATGAAQTLIASKRNELMPAWAADNPTLVYVTDRSGPFEVWVRKPDGADRPVATARDFTSGGTQWFVAPALAPKGDRVIYARVEKGTTARLWISSVAGGTPIQLTNEDATEFPGSWSPDGASFTYVKFRDGKINLMKVKTTGQATPVLLHEIDGTNVPVWSPAGDWIAYGFELTSPDGKATKTLPDHKTPYAFSKDGKQVYGLRLDKDRQILFSLDIATGAEKVIGTIADGFVPASNLSPSIRLSLSPDGKSITYGSGTFTSNLWMLEGFAKTKSRLAGLGLLR
jgi:eukaryotic-like serine/threonine-protein kinase